MRRYERRLEAGIVALTRELGRVRTQEMRDLARAALAGSAGVGG